MARFGIYLTEAQRLALRKAALDERTSVTELVELLITEYLAKRKKGGRQWPRRQHPS